MSHTPEQARDLWCPMVRVGVMPSSGGPSAVNDPTVDLHGTCIADKCAMWRWTAPQLGKRDKAPTHGYCGLAGRPEVTP